MFGYIPSIIINNTKNSEVLEIKGDKVVSGVVINNVKTNKKQEVKINGVFIEVGRVAKSDFLEGLVNTNDVKQVIINEVGETNVPGIFAAGDITNTPNKQIAVATGLGVNASLSCYTYLQKKKGEDEKIGSDWGKV